MRRKRNDAFYDIALITLAEAGYSEPLKIAVSHHKDVHSRIP